MTSSKDVLDAVVEAMGGARREGQERMATAVDEAIDRDGHLLVQAGTGTGKSIGYLVPALLKAVQDDSRVVVSTATLALQRQIVTSDAPRVADAIEKLTSKRPRVALLKGWNNYVCLRKAAGGYPEEDALLSRASGEYGASATGEEVVRLRDWAMSTDTGDRDDLVPGVSERAWRQVSIAKPECIGAKCPLRMSCFPVLARQAAEDAAVVITNHSMLGVHASGAPVLPEANAYIVDEAHDLAERVTSQLTVSVSKYDLTGLARLLRRQSILATGLESAADALDTALDGIDEGRIETLSSELTDALLLVLGELQQVRENVSELSDKDESSVAAKNVARNRVDTLVDVVDQLLSDHVRSGALVPWVARDADDRASLYVAPLDVSSSLADQLFEGKAAILTSATLKVGGAFDSVARDVGFLYPSQGPWEGIDVGTPFDYPRQGIRYVATHVPRPSGSGISEAQLDEIVELVRASRGGALGLFTSRRAAEEAAEYVRDRVDTPVLCQGDDQLPTLVKCFSDDDEASLFGTISLWQGVDVPGRTCRLVIIDKIPFPRPNEPLTQARQLAAGRNGFYHVSVTRAALLLAQGAGRLIRTMTDKGVVAILDPRILTAGYGAFLVRSLPEFWPTTDSQLVREALARLADAES